MDLKVRDRCVCFFTQMAVNDVDRSLVERADQSAPHDTTHIVIENGANSRSDIPCVGGLPRSMVGGQRCSVCLNEHDLEDFCS